MKWAGHTFLLKIKLSGEYVTLAGQRDTNRSRQIRMIDASDKDSRWRQLLEGGVISDTITASGLVQDAEAHRLLATLAASGEFHEFQLVYADGYTTAGRYQVATWSGSGDFRAAQQYNLALARAESLRMKRLLGATFVNGGQVLTAAANPIDIPIVDSAAIVGVILFGQGATEASTGSCVVDVRKATVDTFPPSAGQSIVGGSPPSIVNARASQDVALVGWSPTTVVAGDVVRLVLTSVSDFMVVEGWLILELDT